MYFSKELLKISDFQTIHHMFIGYAHFFYFIIVRFMQFPVLDFGSHTALLTITIQTLPNSWKKALKIMFLVDLMFTLPYNCSTSQLIASATVVWQKLASATVVRQCILWIYLATQAFTNGSHVDE